jgi:hypothetical protein
MSELYEMGWNDTLGNIRGTTATVEAKDGFLKKLITDEIGLPRYEPDYVRGVKEAAQAILDGKAMSFLGPPSVVAEMEANCERR